MILDCLRKRILIPLKVIEVLNLNVSFHQMIEVNHKLVRKKKQLWQLHEWQQIKIIIWFKGNNKIKMTIIFPSFLSI